MLKPKCDSCKKYLEKGDEIIIMGEWPGMGLLLPPILNYPYLNKSKFFHNICFNKQFKKK